MRPTRFGADRTQFSWALYDWANSAFATTVMAGFFPVFFKEFWATDLNATDSTFWLGLANSLASLVIVLFGPVLGAVSDCGGLKKRLLFKFALLGILMTGALFWVGQGQWLFALLLYGGGIIGFSGSNVFYDALLLEIAPRDRLERISALGFALGYLGGGLLFAVNVVMVLQPHWFGLADAGQAVRWSFLTVALWWAVFSLPVLLFVHEARPARRPPVLRLFGRAFGELADTFRHLRQSRMAFLFLLAYWFYIDGVDTIVRMAVDYGLSIGLESSDLLTALLVTQFVGFPAALVFGHWGQRVGPKRGIQTALVVYVLAVLWAWRMDSAWEFYSLAVVIGLVQGGLQALSRALFARLIPPERSGEFFGFYNMLGKFAAVLGPLMVGWVSALSGDPRMGIVSVLVLFLIGALLLAKVDVAAGEAAVLRTGS